MPSGVSSARHFVTGGAALPACWCKKRRRAFGPPASMLACRMPIRRLSVGRYAPVAVCSGSFLPPKFCGGQKWPVCFERKRLRRVSVYPPPPPVGVREKGKKGIAGLRVAPVGRSKATRSPSPALRRRWRVDPLRALRLRPFRPESWLSGVMPIWDIQPLPCPACPPSSRP